MRIRLPEEHGSDDRNVATSPLAIGVSEVGEARFGDEVAAAPAAWLRATSAGLLVQPGKAPDGVRLNGATLTESKWIATGDELGIGDELFRFDLANGIFALRLLPSTSAAGQQVPELELPSDPPPTEALPSEAPIDDAPAAAPAEPPAPMPLAEPTPSRKPRPLKRSGWRRSTKLTIAAVMFALLAGVSFVLAAVSLEIEVTPMPDSLHVTGTVPPVRLQERYLALPGTYTIEAHKTGYRPLHEMVTIEFGERQALRFPLRKLPGVLNVASTPLGATVTVAGQVVGQTPVADLEVEAGPLEVRVELARRKPAVERLEITGMGREQSLAVTLEPGWGTVQLDSEPGAADVYLGGELVGQTPLQLEPMAGSHEITLRKAGWNDARQVVIVEAGSVQAPLPIRLERAEADLRLVSEPAGARVTLDGRFAGETPLTVSAKIEIEHDVAFALPGYLPASRTTRFGLEGGELRVGLQPELGVVFVLAEPADATLLIDGKPLDGPASRRLQLSTVEHEIELRRAGHEPHRETVTPTVGVSKRIDVALPRLEPPGNGAPPQPAKADDAPLSGPNQLTTAEGQTLLHFAVPRGFEFDMGSSRRDPDRRANEGRYPVLLTRPFAVGVKEVTNAEFRRFLANHDSGTADGIDLNEPDHPVASVSWEQAASYLNWLSDKDGLPHAYREAGGAIVAVTPPTTGYRLPTEAEWAFVARYGGDPNATSWRYPWGDQPNPPERTGNYGDASAMSLLDEIIPDYDDGFAATAPAGSFPAGRSGCHDLGGNVSEWCHDAYQIVPAGVGTRARRDPTGPHRGAGHVVRGASWRDSSRIALRLVYRAGAETGRDDLGFRIARYADQDAGK